MTGRHPSPTALLSVALGAAVGAVLRWTLGEVVPDGDGFPTTTLAINATGAFLLALLPAVALVRDHPHRALFAGPGLLGGFTTLSAYADQGRALWTAGEGPLAASYLFGTIVACLAAVALASALTTPAQRQQFADEEGDE